MAEDTHTVGDTDVDPGNVSDAVKVVEVKIITVEPLASSFVVTEISKEVTGMH